MRRPEGEADPVHHRPVGTILNPTDHQGQIEDGVMQGIGFALMEELKYEEGAGFHSHLRRIQDTHHVGHARAAHRAGAQREWWANSLRWQEHRRAVDQPGGAGHRQRRPRRGRGRHHRAAGDGGEGLPGSAGAIGLGQRPSLHLHCSENVTPILAFPHQWGRD